jgi:hypothetical protein
MSANGKHLAPEAAHVLRWQGRALTLADLQKGLNGHREVVLAPRAVITPSALDELRSRGVQLVRAEESDKKGPTWGIGQDRPYPLVQSAVRALARDGVVLKEWPGLEGLPCRWAQAVAECVAAGECAGGVLFCEGPELVACVANKVRGLRAVAVSTVGAAARALWHLAPNLLVVEMPGRTFFEARQLVRMLCAAAPGACPDGVACTLRELEQHARR